MSFYKPFEDCQIENLSEMYMDFFGEISNNNILLSHLQIAYNQVNNPTDLANPIGLSEFKGCEYIVTTTITVNEGQWTRTTPGSYTWTCPANITSVSVACCGGGGGG